MKSLKKSNAQQLVEFMLMVPFMIIILGIITEYAYALNVKMTLNEGLKQVTASIYREIKPGLTQKNIDAIVSDKLTTYLEQNNAPVNSENALTVNSAIGGESAMFFAKYTYVSAFTLPNVYFYFLPETMTFTAVVPVPKAFLITNDEYLNSPIKTAERLDAFWNSTGLFTSDDSFKESKEGLLKSETASSSDAITQSFAFLWGETVDLDNDGTEKHAYRLINWLGKNLSGDESNPYYVCFADGDGDGDIDGVLYRYNSATSTYSKLPQGINGIIGNRTNIIIFEGFDPATNSGNWSNCTGSSLADTSSQCVLKAALSSVEVNKGQPYVNYDNIIDIFDYNSALLPPSYTVDSVGSRIVVHKKIFSNVLVKEIFENPNAKVEIDSTNFGSKL